MILSNAKCEINCLFRLTLSLSFYASIFSYLRKLFYKVDKYFLNPRSEVHGFYIGLTVINHKKVELKKQNKKIPSAQNNSIYISTF